MIKTKTLALISLIFLIVLALQGCTFPESDQMDIVQATSTPGDIPTWTPRPQDVQTLPTETRPAPVMDAPPMSQSVPETPPASPTPTAVTITMKGGNLNIRRGPSLDYNPTYLFKDGETAHVVGRDRISRWILIEVPSVPGARGWVTTETDYTTISGDLPSLPFLTEEPARPAYIRNCTNHLLYVLPADMTLQNRFDTPYNEERFSPGVYKVFDLEVSDVDFQEVNLVEGQTVDIRLDGNGEKSKCE